MGLGSRHILTFTDEGLKNSEEVEKNKGRQLLDVA